MNVSIYEWSGSLSTEERIFADMSDSGVQELLNLAYEGSTKDAVKQSICRLLGISQSLDDDYLQWSIEGKSQNDIRNVIGVTAKKVGWYKRIDLGEQVGLVVADELRGNANIPSATTLNTLESWVYGN